MLDFSRRMTTPTLVGLLGLLLWATACTPSNQSSNAAVSPSPAEIKKVTSAGVVSAQSQNTEISAGGSGEAGVRLVIQKGYHINANPPSFPYLIATALEIKPADGITVGKVTYPNAVTGKFAFSEEPLAVYEGEAELKAQLKVDPGTPPGNRSLNAVLRIQACDDQVCYPPGQIDLQIPVTVK